MTTTEGEDPGGVEVGGGEEPTQLPAEGDPSGSVDDPDAPRPDHTLPGDLPTDQEEGGVDEEAPPDESGEPVVPSDGGEPVEVDDDAAWVGRVSADASARYEKMTANPAHRGDPNSTMSAWVLAEIDDPHEQRAKIEAEANTRVEALRASGATEHYIRKQLAGQIVYGKFD